VPVLVPTSVLDSDIGASVPTLDWKVYKGHERLVERGMNERSRHRESSGRESRGRREGRVTCTAMIVSVQWRI
jgi:hypothetical protein